MIGRNAISFHEVRNEFPNRSYYITSNIKRLGNFFSQTIGDIYNSLWVSLSMDHLDINIFKEAVWPAVTSATFYVLNDFASSEMSRAYAGNDDYKVAFQFMIGTTLFAYSATNCITEKPSSKRARSAAIALDTVAIINQYSSTFEASRLFLDGRLFNSSSLIVSLGMSTLVVPGIISHLAHQLQQILVKRKYAKGAQRSDTAFFSSGLSVVSNTYFQANYFLISEILSWSRVFQLGLISDNILNEKLIKKQFKNLPALIVDAFPPIIRKMVEQCNKLAKDSQFNNTEQTVVRFSKSGAQFFKVPRYKLRKGDLVVCDQDFETSSVPVSGEIFSLKRNKEGQLTPELESKKFSVNLKAHNGEDIALEQKTSTYFSKDMKKISLHAIRKKEQAAILAGSNLDLNEEKNLVVRIQVAEERTLNSDYEKKSVIDQIISEHKNRCVWHSIACSLLLSTYLQGNQISQIPVEALRLVFNLFQMQIPFSETFLRDLVNTRLMKDLNGQSKNPLQTIDALRVTDFCNALGGYYAERFSNGTAIVSDKTGTLTTSQMNVLGIWTSDMKPDVQRLLTEDKKSELFPDRRQMSECFEIFSSAYTVSKKSAELEEFAMLELFKRYFAENFHFNIKKVKSNHFEKTLLVNNALKSIETFHLGLYKSFGGRLTLVSDGENRYLVFCGIPRPGVFKDTPLLKQYSEMTSRQRVLSRDWCVARTWISDEQFETLKKYFEEENSRQIEKSILENKNILSSLVHCGTFIIDNPLKPGADNFISNCQSINVPVFVATGDNINAAENIAKVLCPDNVQSIFKISSHEKIECKLDEISRQSTVIFSGINEECMAILQQLMNKPLNERPAIIFSEMSTEDKGRLVRHLKNQGFFVVANGDGTNDVSMMKQADMVLAHLNENGTYETGVEQFANLNDGQLKNLFPNSDKSFYELFDIHQPRSRFINTFKPLANSQEKVSLSLIAKGNKMAWEWMKAVGIPVMQMPLQHEFGILFDFAWFGITYETILGTKDCPADNKNLSISRLPFNLMLGTLALSIVEAKALQAMFDEATDEKVMLMTLGALYVGLNCLYSAFGHVRDKIKIAEPIDKPADEKRAAKPGFFSSCWRRRAVEENVNNRLSLKSS